MKMTFLVKLYFNQLLSIYVYNACHVKLYGVLYICSYSVSLYLYLLLLCPIKSKLNIFIIILFFNSKTYASK